MYAGALSAALWPKMDEGSSAAAPATLALPLLAVMAVDTGVTRLTPPVAEVAVMGDDVAAVVAAAALDVLAASSTCRVPVKFFRESWALLPLPVRPCRNEIMLASSSAMLLVLDDCCSGVRRKLTPLNVRVMDVLDEDDTAAAGSDGHIMCRSSATATGASAILEGMTGIYCSEEFRLFAVWLNQIRRYDADWHELVV